MDSAARQANIRAEAGCFDKDIKALSMSEDLELSKQNSLSEQCNPYLTCRLGKSSTMSRDPCSYPHRRRLGEHGDKYLASWAQVKGGDVPMTTAPDLLDDLDLPCVDGRVHWDSMTCDELFGVVRHIDRLLRTREPDKPTDGVLQRSLQLEETWRTATALQHRYAGLLQDAYNSPELRTTIGLPKGKTPFRD